MIFFKIFIVHFIILFHEIIGIHLPLFQYKAGVAGIFTCKYRTTKGVAVFISEKPFIKKERKPILKTYVRYRNLFYITATVRRLKKPHLYVKIFHRCFNFKIHSEGLIMKKIPSKFIFRTRKKIFFYPIGPLELSDGYPNEIFVNGRLSE